MFDPLGSFCWASLYERYDHLCQGFDPKSPYLQCLARKVESDRALYSLVRDRVQAEIASQGALSLCSYQAILYWKLYSQPAAVANILRDLSNTRNACKTKSGLVALGRLLPKEMTRSVSGVITAVKAFDGVALHGAASSNALPVRTTVLHFMYSKTVPIFDKMVLRAVGINKEGANGSLEVLKEYMPHAWALADRYAEKMADLDPLGPVRHVDMALWVCRGTRSTRTMQELPRTRAPVGPKEVSGLSGWSNVASRFHEGLEKTMRPYNSSILSTSDINEIVSQDQSLEADVQWIQPSDHCLNHTNAGACWCAKTRDALFERLGRGKYRVL